MQSLSSLFDGRTILLLGIGNPMRGDDGAGPYLAARVPEQEKVKTLICGDLPENYTYEIRTAQAELIVLVDAVDFGAKPGEVRLFSAQEITQKRFNSHHPSLHTLMTFLAMENKAEILLLGIQPQNTALNQEISKEVRETMLLLIELFSHYS